jgi:hypothetical protein
VSSLHRYPSAAEAVEAVREFLRSDAADSAYYARVAAHLLGIVERELAADRGDAWLAERLAVLGVDDEDVLAAQVRDGDWDDRYDELVAVLSEITDERLRVANPRHLAPVADDDPRRS